MNDYLFTYRYLGKDYSLTVTADSREEAIGRVSCMGMARYDGILHGVYPLRLGWWVRLKCWWQNRRNPK